MPKIRLVESEKITYAKQLILANLGGPRAKDMELDEIIKLYPALDKGVFGKAQGELIAGGKIEIVPGAR